MCRGRDAVETGCRKSTNICDHPRYGRRDPLVSQEFAKAEHLADSSFKAIGALSSVELGWFDWDVKKYQTAVKLKEQVELLSLIGDVALKDNEPQIHAHLVIGRRDGTAHGGHLMSATVRPTCEIVVTENPQHLQKEIDAESGLALIRF